MADLPESLRAAENPAVDAERAELRRRLQGAVKGLPPELEAMLIPA